MQLLIVLLVMILFISVPTSTPYAVALPMGLFGEVLKLIIAAAHKINVVSKSLVALYGPFTSGNGCLVIMECFLYDLL